MEATFNTEAIILNRRPFKENDCWITIYSSDKGKLEIVARGVKKIKSKLAAHLEPFNYASLMIVKGKKYDYVGSAASLNCYANVKKDFEKIEFAGRLISIFNKVIKYEEGDEDAFYFLKNFLDFINKENSLDCEWIEHIFLWKLLVILGHKPELFYCIKCKKKLILANNKFNPSAGGIVCETCGEKKDLTISNNSVKILRLIHNLELEDIIKIKIKQHQKKEIFLTISSFYHYLFY